MRYQPMPLNDRFGNVDADAERPVGFLLTPIFSILAFLSALEPPGMRLSDSPPYTCATFLHYTQLIRCRGIAA